MTPLLFQPALAGTASIACSLAGAGALVPATAAAIADWRTHRVPNELVGLALAPALIAVMFADEPVHMLASVVLGMVLMALPLLIVHLIVPPAMGFGDVKLAIALGAGLGVLAPGLAVLALAVGSGLTLLAAVSTRRSTVAFAPGLVIGAAAALALGALEGWSLPA
jgi:leader peptidase (prepilin peptidase)/N-methyltransferase